MNHRAMSEVSRHIFTGRFAALQEFCFKPASAEPLGFFRLGLSAVLLLQAWLLYPVFLEFSSAAGLVQREVARALVDPSLPTLNAAAGLLISWGLSEASALYFLGSCYVLSLGALLLGRGARCWALLAWYLHWCLVNTGYSGAYGADMYAHIFLFYLIWLPAGDAYVLGRWAKPVWSWQACLGIRVLQVHMGLSYLVSGVEKASGEMWWNGEILWRSLNMPGYSFMDFHWLAAYPLLPTLLGLATLVIEIGYGLAMSYGRTRRWWVVATCGMHLGIAVFLRLPIFGLLMCVPTLALFREKTLQH